MRACERATTMSSIAASTENREGKRREKERERNRKVGYSRVHDERKSAAKVATNSIPGFPIPESPRVPQAPTLLICRVKGKRSLRARYLPSIYIHRKSLNVFPDNFSLVLVKYSHLFCRTKTRYLKQAEVSVVNRNISRRNFQKNKLFIIYESVS